MQESLPAGKNAQGRGVPGMSEQQADRCGRAQAPRQEKERSSRERRQMRLLEINRASVRSGVIARLTKPFCFTNSIARRISRHFNGEGNSDEQYASDLLRPRSASSPLPFSPPSHYSGGADFFFPVRTQVCR